jgi:glycosyltransferase involved in cell wall biosynthesis
VPGPNPAAGSRVTGDTVIVHVAESFASGTAAAITDFVRNYPDAEHHLVYSLRPEARVDARELGFFASATEMPSGHIARIRFLRRHLHTRPGTAVVHGHSSKAGVYVRLAVCRSHRRPLLYTPHCYAFERSDLSWPMRQSFRAVEWLLSFNTTAYGACSPREASLSRWVIRAPRVVAVPNVSPAGLPVRSATFPGRPIRIVGNGRLGPQKDPRFFAEAIAAASAALPGLRGVWVGDGDAAYVDIMKAHGVEVTGWLTRREALAVMAECDLYLHTALWEGFPISIMEAAGIGLPVVARRRPYLEGFDMPCVIDEPADAARVLTALGDDGALEVLRTQTADALAGNTDAHQRAALRELYGPLGGMG